MDVKVLLGKRIRELRQGRNYTQSQLAEILGIDDKHLSRIELGKNMPNPLVLENLAKIYDIEIKDLFEFSHLQPIEDLKNILIEKIKSLPDEQVVMAYKYVRTFAI